MDTTAASTLFAWIDREIWLVTAQAGERRGGLIATLVNQASFIPDRPRLVVGIARQHHTWELIEQSGACAMHLLAEDNLDLVWHFGLETGRHHDKLDGFDTISGSTGSPLLESTVGWLDCRVETKLDIGDRTLFVLEVVEGMVRNFAPPLTTRRLMELAPSARLTQLQRSRHQHSYLETEALRQWREQSGS